MNDVVQWLLTYVLLYKYVAIFLISVIGTLTVVVPAGTIVIAAVVFATQGYLDLPSVVVTAILGNIVGDNLVYWLSKKYGLRVLTRMGLGRVLRSGGFKTLESRIAEFPKSTIFFSRFTNSLTTAVTIMAGLGNIRFAQFLVIDIIGEIFAILFLCACGVLFGDNWTYVEGLFSHVAILIGSVVLLLILISWRQIRKHHKKAQKEI